MGIFGFNLPYSNEMIEMAENQIGMSKEDIRKIDDPEERKKTQERFKELLEIFLEEKLSGTGMPTKGATGGMVDKKKKGNKIVSPNKNKKSKLAGRLAKRGYGAARK
tara:strand:+ start:10329 stop:10649 length:321 start_codon:yes stop_codon:yes gene_type:complete